VRQTSNEDIRKVFDKNAGIYDRWMGFFERHVAVGARDWAVSMARGAVVEIGVGSGLNLPLYGPEVEHVTGVELSEEMLAVARARVADKRIGRVELRQGDAQALDLPPESADTILSTFTFCTIPDPLAASREAYRVLRPDGVFILAEHGCARHVPMRALLRAIEPLSIRLTADHITRNPVTYLRGAGFSLSEVHRDGPSGVIFRIVAHKRLPS
jgi:ubiquinone/menaquinone biosynthesis C-methylase UbiE